MDVIIQRVLDLRAFSHRILVLQSTFSIVSLSTSMYGNPAIRYTVLCGSSVFNALFIYTMHHRWLRIESFANRIF
jgi:hypothetical protein